MKYLLLFQTNIILKRLNDQSHFQGTLANRKAAPTLYDATKIKLKQNLNEAVNRSSEPKTAPKLNYNKQI
jgi:hypothetical protein